MNILKNKSVSTFYLNFYIFSIYILYLINNLKSPTNATFKKIHIIINAKVPKLLKEFL